MKTLNEIIKRNSQTFEIPENLIKSIIVQESGCRVWAIRYEPAFTRRHLTDKETGQLKSLEKLKGHIPKGINRTTEYMMRATSFGLMQVMGQVAREYGFSKDSLVELCVPELNIYFGCSHFKRLLNLRDGDISRALLNWNGGGNPEYANEVLDKMNMKVYEKFNWGVWL
jgi:soluble lytic murein transglycosylase-like protein